MATRSVNQAENAFEGLSKNDFQKNICNANMTSFETRRDQFWVWSWHVGSLQYFLLQEIQSKTSSKGSSDN